MTRLQEIELQAGKLTEAERAALVTRLLATLPPVLADADLGVAEAKRRDAELDAHPAAGLTDAQFRAAIATSRKPFWVRPPNPELDRSGNKARAGGQAADIDIPPIPARSALAARARWDGERRTDDGRRRTVNEWLSTEDGGQRSEHGVRRSGT
jgi:hypothetical protein